ncbi:glucocorticoid-induced transcript 1 protein-like isoform X1 [Eriocheir sinensis]|uniref:glucocorticoid-induced transcript 1 protein-like isoform X1 n=1 Tax=Eriocheir sinensis TaxID=95602 RepID=UPI0021C5D53F|nr:glucocorticoid-induced transcript 1 protein-like isoform X1 [Eriocheir sinensis]
MSGAGAGEREAKSSRRPSPLRATVPVQAMHRTSPLRLRNRISPDSEITPGLDLSTATPVKGRARTSRGSQGGEGSVLMRRTASLDTIYLKGQWPKDDQPFTHLLHVDKASQTPEEWASSCYGGVSLGWALCEEPYQSSSNSSSNNSSNSGSRRPSVSMVPSPWLGASSHQTPTPSGEQIDKFIRHRLQRTNKEGTSGSGLRYSPVHADHSVLAPAPLHVRSHAFQHANGGSRAIPIPQIPKPLLPPRLRSSVEGLNQEIERLVLRPSHTLGDDIDDVVCGTIFQWGEVARDGRRAPIAEYLKFTRSIDTQTPARGSAVSATSSDHTSPSLSPPTSPPHSQDAAMPSSTPSPNSAQTLATSPHINKFLAREPPDGCERVALKLHEDRSGVTKTGEWPAVRPPGGFTLRPSQGSAFCAPERIGAEEELGAAAAAALHECQHQTDPESVYCPACAGCPGVSPDRESPDPELVQYMPQACQTSPTHPVTCDVGVTTMVPGPTSTSIGPAPELTADQ